MPIRTHPDTAERPEWPMWAFRVSMSITAVLLIDQAVFAGQFLAGSFGALQNHRDGATYAGIGALTSAGVAVTRRWPGRRSLWPMWACLGLFGLIAGQIMLGFARILTLHIPLGVAIITITAAVTGWAWRSPDASVTPAPCNAQSALVTDADAAPTAQ